MAANKGRVQTAWQWRGAMLLAAAGLLVAAIVILDRLFPPPLTRFEDRSPLVLDRDGRLLRAFLSKDDKWRLAAAPGAVDARYLRLLKTYEDKRFDTHPGVDPLAGVRAFGQLIASGRVVSGASTLTMQAARLLEPGVSRGLGGKLRQVVRALQLEVRFTKDEILGVYLTLAPFGGNLEGVRAASLAYFGKEPAALTLGQAALLVALPQSPERQRPDRRPAEAKAARDKVLGRLLAAGAISRRSHDEARGEPMPDRRRAFPFHAPRLARDLLRRHGRDRTLTTMLERPLQRVLEDLAMREAARFDDGASLAVIVVENDSRAVRAYLGGHDFRARGGQMDLAAALRSPGSALKPFVYALAFDDLILHPASLIEDRRRAFGHYAPRNFDRSFQGTVSARMALQSSLNVPAVALLDKVGPNRLYTVLRRAGAALTLPGRAGDAHLPIALGGVGVTLRDLTMLYAGLAAHGRAAPLRFLDGDPPEDGHPITGAAAAWYVADILRGAPLPDGWGQARNIVRDRAIAFKTGTSAGFQDAWAMGFSPRFTVGVWVGRADGTARPGRIGRNAAAPLMLQVFSLLPKEPGGAGPVPIGVIRATSPEDLPPALRRFGIEGRGPGAPDPLRVLYPPSGATVLFPRDGILTFSAEGGRAPLRWIVNGRVLPAGEGGLKDWAVDGAGFVELSVLDRDGRNARSTFRIRR
ncbi:MAG: penicillin-binding protein 1C [Alphaproteobacteria bacterium]